MDFWFGAVIKKERPRPFEFRNKKQFKNRRCEMKQILKLTLLAFILVFAGNASDAQEMKAETPDAIKNLMKFIGDWQSKVALTMEGKTHEVDYMVSCTKTADGNGIFADEKITSPELGTIKAANLAGYDPFEKKIKWFSVDNMGTTHEHVGEWQSPDHLFIQFTGLREGKKYVEKIDLHFMGADELHFKLAATLDGVDAEKAEGIFHKK
jgi:hypothetical protein